MSTCSVSLGVQRNLVAFLFADNLARVANGGPENQIRFRSGHGLDGCQELRRGSILPNLSTRRSCRPTGSRGLGLGLPVLSSTVRFPADTAVNVGVDVPSLHKMRLKVRCAAVGMTSVNVNQRCCLATAQDPTPQVCRQLWEANSVHRPCPSSGARSPRTASCLGRTVNGLN